VRARRVDGFECQAVFPVFAEIVEIFHVLAGPADQRVDADLSFVHRRFVGPPIR